MSNRSKGFQIKPCEEKALAAANQRRTDLRHKATASFFRMGLDIPRVALLTGHKTWAMLRRYTKITAGDVHSIVNKAGAV